MDRVVTTDAKTRDVLEDVFTWEGHDVAVTYLSDGSAEAAVVEAAADADALVVDSVTPVTERVLRETPVRVVARAGTGVDNVDLSAAEAHGAVVVNAPDACREEAATHALALLLSAWRKLRPYDSAVRDGEWASDPEAPIGRLSGATLGLVAFGGVARELVGLVEGFDLDVVAYDPHVDAATIREGGAEPVTFGTLLAASDLVSVHAPLTAETAGLIDDAAFERMRPGAVLVNVARGGVVDENALARALANGEIAGAGLDVLAEEPPAALPADHPNLVVTPHVAWYSEAAVEDVARAVARDVTRVLRGEEPENRVTGGW